MVATLAVAAVALIAAPGTASATNPARRAKEAVTGKTQSDAAFIKEAAQGGMAEVELGRLGVERAQSPDVKQFAQRMVDDHGKANEELKPLARKEGVTIPTTLDPKQKAAKDKLAKLSGQDFDRAYMRDMTSDHDHDVAMFEKHASKTQNPELKSWIEKTLPTLREHQQLAQDTASKVGATMTGRVEGTLHRMTHRGKSNQGEAAR
jgi:putative membrane protein